MLQKQSATATTTTTATCSYSLLSFVPRSVLLSKPTMTAATTTTKLDKKILLQSIYRYLKTSGFSKTVKKLKSEAQLDEVECTDSNLLDLEEICSKHLETLKHATEAHHKSEEDLKSNGSNEVTDAEKVSKKKKVKSDNDDVILIDSHEKSTTEPEGKSKEKKKSKKSADAFDQGEIDNETEKSKKKKKHQTLMNDNNEENASEKHQKSKKKKKQDSDVEDSPVKTNETKKRKRASADDEGDEVDDATPNDKSKEAQAESVANKSDSKVADTNHINDVTNSNNGYKSSGQKSAKKPRNGSAEPTTVKAFQRVKVDEVVIKDERLKDNSYWAKDGAESGYGAKAQEILGQVRGKDFRHEKTKKKRGSYRGGQIDFGTHSIKFNDSDDE